MPAGNMKSLASVTDNDIEPAGATALSNALKVNTELKQLDLAGTCRATHP